MKISSKNLNIFLLSLGIILFFGLVQHASADALGQYQPLVPLPGIGAAEANNLPMYLVAIFKFAIGFAGLMAVVMITIGGFQYMSTDAIGGKSEGKERITQAVTGLLLAIASWLILNTINPKTLEFKLTADKVAPISSPTSSTTAAGDWLNNRTGNWYKIVSCINQGQTTHRVVATFSYTPGNQAESAAARTRCDNEDPPNGIPFGPTPQCDGGGVGSCSTTPVPGN